MTFPADGPVTPEPQRPVDLERGHPAARPPSEQSAGPAPVPPAPLVAGPDDQLRGDPHRVDAGPPPPPASVTPGGPEWAPWPPAAQPPPDPPAHEPPPRPPARPPSRLKRFRAWRFAPFVEILATIALALVLAEGVQAAVVKPFVIPSPSMEPTLEPSQRVLVNRLAYDFGSPHRGDIVVFHPPSSQSCPESVPSDEPCPRSSPKPASDYYVKRVIGLPGDRIAIRDGHPVINGVVLSPEPYIAACGGAPECDMPRAITVPKGEYFMMGDNRGDSDDSRFWGPVPESWIIGQVFATYWPPDRIGVF